MSEGNADLAEPAAERVLERLLQTLDKEVTSNPIEQLNPDVPSHLERDARQQFIAFRLAGQKFAAPVQNIAEIVRLGRVTPVPNLPQWIVGVTNLRGEIMSVVDLRALLELPPSPRASEPTAVVARTADDSVTASLVVDGMEGMRYLAPGEIDEAISAIGGAVQPHLLGIRKGADEDLLLLDFESLLRSPRMTFDQ